MSLLNLVNYLFIDYSIREKEMCERFKIKQQEAQKLYWDACKYPRKKKKLIRKKAISDYSFYTQMSKLIFNFGNGIK